MLRVFASAIALTVLCGAAAPHRPVEPAQGISPLDIIELQIGYTTILARYYKPVAPRVLVDGARTGIAADLVAHGIDDELPYTPARVTFYDGGDLIESLVFRSLARYGSRVGAHDLVQAALAGELSALKDPYSVLFFPQQFKKFNAFLGNEKIGGIGAVVSFVPASGEAHVDRVLPGSPAEKIGVQEDDAIVAIDGRSVAAIGGQGLRDALRGKIGTTVRIEIARAEAHLTFAIVRAEIHDPEVTVARFGDVGYLALSRFGDNAGSEITADLADLQAHGARAFILDLRGNGGGYGDEATAVASAFIASGPIYSTRERNGATTVSRASGKANFHAPLAVLVDGDTASAAEIVAGAVQDGGVGTIVGTRTFGKGVVQSVFPLPDGSAFKVTTARYTTPKGRDIDRVGIEPDVTVAEPANSKRGDPASDPQLKAAADLLDSKT
jgi:carboxyl-terminal processing protease